jgi:hypothetical protein
MINFKRFLNFICIEFFEVINDFTKTDKNLTEICSFKAVQNQINPNPNFSKNIF